MSIISCASQTHKKDKPNQDDCDIFENKKFGFKGVIVADGLGSHYNSELSSKFCTAKLKEKLEFIDKLPFSFNELFAEVKKELEIFAECELSQEDRSKTNLGTTLICAVEFEHEYQIAYVGNGSIFQIAGNFNHFNASYSLPWNSVNFLNPHNKEEDGQSKMFKYISTAANVSTIPSVITLSKNDDAYGDIIVIASDGVYSNDEAKMGPDANGVLWVMGEETMIELYKALNGLFKNNPSEIAEKDLKFDLDKYLTLLKNRNIMDDDTTLGVIISEKTIQYQQKRWEEQEKSQIIQRTNVQSSDKINTDILNNETNTGQ
jgi:serine/threonine protein phosphatase PrpC